MVRNFIGWAEAAAQIPLVIVWLVGLVMALSRWRRHPRVSLFALIGLLILIAVTFINSIGIPWLQVLLLQQGAPARTLAVALGVASLITAAIRAVGWGFMIAAIFTARGPRQQVV